MEQLQAEETLTVKGCLVVYNGITRLPLVLMKGFLGSVGFHVKPNSIHCTRYSNTVSTTSTLVESKPSPHR